MTWGEGHRYLNFVTVPLRATETVYRRRREATGTVPEASESRKKMTQGSPASGSSHHASQAALSRRERAAWSAASFPEERRVGGLMDRRFTAAPYVTATVPAAVAIRRLLIVQGVVVLAPLIKLV